MSLDRIEDAFRSLLTSSLGDRGFIPLSSGETIQGHFSVLRAVGGDIILGSQTTSSSGDDPIENHRISNGDCLYGNFSFVEVSDLSDEGAFLYVYKRTPLVKGFYTGEDEFSENLDQETTLSFSTRRTSGFYSGSCMRVSRDTDGKSLDIGFRSDGWLDTQRLLSFIGNETGFLDIWYNQQGSVNGLQDEVGAKPRVVNNGSLEVDENGNPVVKFFPGSFLKVDSFMDSIERSAIFVFSLDASLPISTVHWIMDGNEGNRSAIIAHPSVQRYAHGAGPPNESLAVNPLVDVTNNRHFHLFSWSAHGPSPPNECWENISGEGDGASIQGDLAGEFSMQDFIIGSSQGGTRNLDASFQLIHIVPKKVGYQVEDIQGAIIEAFELNETIYSGTHCPEVVE